MAISKHTQVMMMMGFHAKAGKLEANDRVRGYGNTYVNIVGITHHKMDAICFLLDNEQELILSCQQMVLSAQGWKQAKDIVQKEWLCGKEEDAFLVVKKIKYEKQMDMIELCVEETGSIVGNGVVLGVYA